jgi:hypothetical protein
MKNYVLVILLAVILLSSCQDSKKERHNVLYGDWQFLTSNGDYNEAFFTDTTYLSYNVKIGLFSVAHYFIRNDTLFSDADKRSKGQSAIARFASIEKDRVIIINAFSQDTLYRINENKNVISNISFPDEESEFKDSFMERYEAFLLERGIIDDESSKK